MFSRIRCSVELGTIRPESQFSWSAIATYSLASRACLYNICLPDQNMASNIEKVEEKVEEDVERAIKTSRTREEIERKLDPNDVSFKIKDETKEGKKQPYKPNQ
jgi:hypothetical protein